MHKLQLTGRRTVLPENWDILKPLHAIYRIVGLCDSFSGRINLSAFLLAINVRMSTSVGYAWKEKNYEVLNIYTVGEKQRGFQQPSDVHILQVANITDSDISILNIGRYR